METKTTYKMIGLMSGTSGDGLDIAFCEFDKQEKWTFNIPMAETIPFPLSLEESLANSYLLAGEELTFLDMLFGKWMGKEVKSFCEKNQLKPHAIASHGHTVFHQPGKGFSLQIGNGWGLHQTSGFPVINDFRSLDVLLGGQGAPLVPVGDRLLFGAYDFCLNLGGIANISMETNNGRKAFDISPFNLLLNHFAKKKGRSFDDKGDLAKTGMIIPGLLQDLENFHFYQQPGAKSLGREIINQEYLPLLTTYEDSIENILATLVEHFSLQISKVALRNLSASPNTLLVTGGGAYHQFFLKRLAYQCGERVKIIIPDNQIIDFKEALIFGFLGILRMRNEYNCLSSVTGASRDNSGGTLYGFDGEKDS
ncbi:MAG: anhydro-N-acetylmuramic acid kinase [Anditalea sp.]